MVINTNNDITNNASNHTRQKSSNVSSPPDALVNTTSANNSGAESNSNDSVQLSAESQVLKRLEANIQQVPEIDTPKVEAIKAAIANGEYTINAEHIAEKLLQSEDFLG